MSISKTQENLDLGVVDPFPTTPALTLEGGGGLWQIFILSGLVTNTHTVKHITRIIQYVS